MKERKIQKTLGQNERISQNKSFFTSVTEQSDNAGYEKNLTLGTKYPWQVLQLNYNSGIQKYVMGRASVENSRGRT